MDITYNKVDQTQLPINPSRVSASEYNQIAGSLMYIINASGLTPDSQNNEQLLNALKATIISFPYIVETYSNGTSWYRVWSDGWCEQGGVLASVTGGTSRDVVFIQPYKDTSYYFNTLGQVAYSSSVQASDVISNKSTTGLTFSSGTIGTANFAWYACGYID